jgi:CxxC-x17-CxxC domain-containing protein
MAKFEYSKSKNTKRSFKDNHTNKDSFSKKKSFGDKPTGRRESKSEFRSNSRGRGRPDLQMTKVVCSSCGSDCEVPFKPSNNKPIYCSDCFGSKGKGGSDRMSSKDLEVINNKLDKIMNILKIR